MAFNNIMQLATATLVGSNVFKSNPTVVEWGNQRFRYNQEWTTKCSEISKKEIRKPVQYLSLIHI